MPPADPEGKRLPIKIDATCNGEFVPIPLDAANRRANRLAREWAGDNARRRGVSRRGFMVSACGTASTLLAINAVNAAAGRFGRLASTPSSASSAIQAACSQDQSSRCRSSCGAPSS